MTDQTHEEFILAERRLSVSLASHKGQWVAIRDHEVVLSRPTLDELLLACDAAGLVDDVDHSVFQVPHHFGASAL